jgi:hypothetical protein
MITRKGVEDLEKGKEKEFEKIHLKYKNGIEKLLPIVNMFNREESSSIF